MVEARSGAGTPRGRTRWRRLGLLLLAYILVWSSLGVPVSLAAQPVVDQYADVRADLRDEVTAAAGDDLSAYVIDVTMDEAASTLAGTMAVTYHNASGEPLNEVYFRLYPNIGYYGEGDLAISDVAVAGAPGVAMMEVDDSALRVDLPEPLADGDAVEIMLSFATTVPANSAGSYGIFSRETGTGTWILADWHPVVAVFEPGHGWHLDPATPAGDPTHAASSFFDVTITAPESLITVGSGVVAESEVQDGLRRQRYIAGPAREFTLVVDNDYVIQSDQVDGITVTVYTEPDVALEIGRQTLEIAMQSLQVFSELFGPYPYTELDLVQTRLDGALAVSWSGIIFLDGPAMLSRMATSDPLGFETIVAHEISHLWWGATVGTNSNDHTFINEGLATLSATIYLEQTAGPEVAAVAREEWMLRPARWLVQRGDVIADQPASASEDQAVRSAAVYGKGSLGFAAIRREIGDDAFFAALHAYARDSQFDIVTPEELKNAFEAAAETDLDALWSHWFNEAAMSLDEVEAFVE